MGISQDFAGFCSAFLRFTNDMAPTGYVGFFEFSRMRAEFFRIGDQTEPSDRPSAPVGKRHSPRARPADVATWTANESFATPSPELRDFPIPTLSPHRPPIAAFLRGPASSSAFRHHQSASCHRKGTLHHHAQRSAAILYVCILIIFKPLSKISSAPSARSSHPGERGLAVGVLGSTWQWFSGG
jgi:hypothetical protein